MGKRDAIEEERGPKARVGCTERDERRRERRVLAPMSWRCEGVKEKALSFEGGTIAPNLVADNSSLVSPFFLPSRRLLETSSLLPLHAYLCAKTLFP